jgi:hypothetical protein
METIYKLCHVLTEDATPSNRKTTAAITIYTSDEEEERAIVELENLCLNPAAMKALEIVLERLVDYGVEINERLEWALESAIESLSEHHLTEAEDAYDISPLVEGFYSQNVMETTE